MQENNDVKIKKSCRYYSEDKELEGFILPNCHHKQIILNKNSNCKDCVYYQASYKEDIK